MLFNSLEFLFIFLPIVFTVYFLCNKFKKYGLGKFWLLIASLYFYSYYEIKYLPIILSSIFFNYAIGLVLLKSDWKININKKYVLIFGLIGNLALLCYYKYWGFLIDCFNNLANQHFNAMHLLLPLGISFFTFQQISYIVDCYKGEAKYTNIIDYALFVTFFPQLIAGPIVHHQEIIPQFEDENKKRIIQSNISMGFFLITVGLVKKVLLADNFNPFIDSSIANLANIDFANAWFLSLSIGLQGYFDFSGYCDMALGLGCLFNITLPVNFSSPYRAIDISDFWRKWHITLGRFLKYYVYIPLGGSRNGTFNTYRNLCIVFLLIGIWHGANWPCITYGFVNAVLVCFNKFWKSLKIEINKYLAIAITFTTMIFIAPLMLIKTIPQCVKVWTSMLGVNTIVAPISIDNLKFIFASEAQTGILLFAASIFIIFCLPNSNELAEKYIKADKPVLVIVLAAVFIFSALSITQTTRFIYFQF